MSFGFGFGLPSWQTLSGGFNPSSLFVGGVQGTWFDPSDPATLFSDTAGTTPSPTPGGGALSVVGLMLDKSQGGGQINQLVTGDSSNFSGGTVGSWTSSVSFASTAAVVSGAMRVSSSVVFGRQVLPVSLVAGRVYVIQATINAVVGSGTGGTATANFGISTSSNGASATIFGSTTSGTPTVVQNRYTPSTTGTYYLICGDDGNATTGTTVYDDIYVNQLPLGNHAISYNTTTARPELSARVNLLTYSEQFDNGAWVKTRTTVSANTTATTDPLGGNTADKITEGVFTANDCSVNYGLFTHTASVSYTLSVYAKAAERTRVLILWPIIAANNPGVIVDLSTGTAVSTGGSPTVSITNAGNGWWRIALTATSGNPVNGNTIRIGPTANTTSFASTLGYNGDGTSGIYLWGADLRPSNIGTSVPAYQRIADQYTYDSSGFPRYLAFNGTASGMYTPANLNLSATDKATVFAGVRKLSDAAAAVLTELSAAFGSNSGSFAIFAPDSAAAQYYFGLQGTTVGRYIPTGFAAPITNVLSVGYNIGAATLATEITPRINGVLNQSNPSASDAGTGNFGTYPLYIGSRNNAGSWLNGYLYSLIVVGAASTAAQISSTESWINTKEGGVY